MKLSFGIKVGMIAGLVLLACGYLGMGYVGAVNEFETTRGQINLTLEALKKVSRKNGDISAEKLQFQIDRNASELKRVLSIFPSGVERTKVIRGLLDTADSVGVSVSLVSISDSVKKTEERVYPVISLNLQIKGTYECIMNFISALEGGSPETRQEWLSGLTIDSVSLLVMMDQMEEGANRMPVIGLSGVSPPVDNKDYEGSIVVLVYEAPDTIAKKSSGSKVKNPSRT